MRRRQYLKATAVASTAGLAGCSGILGGGGGPASVAKSWIKAANKGRKEKVKKLTHSDSPMSGNLSMLLGFYEMADLLVKSTSVLNKGDSKATVEAKVKVSRNGQSETSTSKMELRTEDGNWRVYSIGSSGGSSGGGTTSASF